MKRTEIIYLDYAATAPIDSRVREVINDTFLSLWGNTTGLHKPGREANEALERVRQQTADLLRCKNRELLFTSSATESNNTILKSVAYQGDTRKKHIICSGIEHASVYETCNYLRASGFDITVLPVDDQGYVSPDDVRNAIRSDTALVCVMLVNNEIGTIQPVREIGTVCRDMATPLMVDAVQALGKLPLKLNELPVDFLTASAHKIHGPLGAGLLYIRSGLTLQPLIHGGGQERGLRASTVNLPAIAGFGAACRIAEGERENEQNRYRTFRQHIFTAVSEMQDVRVNGDPEYGLPNIISLSFKNTDAELLIIDLDRKGIAVASGSSCSGSSMNTSRTLRACGLRDEWARGTIRISMGRYSTEEEILRFTTELKTSLKRIRKLS